MKKYMLGFIVIILLCGCTNNNGNLEVYSLNNINQIYEEDVDSDIVFDLVSNTKINKIELIKPNSIAKSFNKSDIDLTDIILKDNEGDKYFYSFTLSDLDKNDIELLNKSKIKFKINNVKKDIDIGKIESKKLKTDSIHDFMSFGAAVKLKYADSFEREIIPVVLKSKVDGLKILEHGFTLNNENISCASEVDLSDKKFDKGNLIDGSIICLNNTGKIASVTGRPYFKLEYKGKEYLVYYYSTTIIYAKFD